MKASLVLPISALALTASAEPILRHRHLAHSVRTSATLSSVASQISDAIVALDDVVKPLKEDAAPPVLAGADKLIQVLRSSRQEIDDITGTIAASDIVALPGLLESLSTAGETLMADLKANKKGVEAARICGATEIKLRSVRAAADRLVSATVAKLPEAARVLVTDATSGLAQVLENGADAFGPVNCRNKVVAPSAPPAPTAGMSSFPALAPPTTAGPMPTGSVSSFPVRPPPATVLRRAANGTVETVLYSSVTIAEDCEEEPTSTATTDVTTATVIDTTDCSEDVTPVPTLPPATSASSATEAPSTEVKTSTVIDTTDCETETPSTTPPPFASNSTLVIVPPTTIASETSQLITAPTEAPTPTVGTTIPVGSTAIYPTSTLPPIPTAGAVMNRAVGPVGIVAGLVAALLL